MNENEVKLSSKFSELKTIWGTYHRCHYWNNFEIVDLNWFRGEKYQKFFDYLDKLGGFYYYRCK